MNLQNNKGKFNKEQFCQLEDEQVIEKVHVGDSDALDYLITKYRNFVRAKARSYFLIGADREDIVQEGMIGLYKSIRDFKEDKLASTGAIEHIPVARVTNLARTLEEMKERGIWVVGTDASAREDFRNMDGNMPLALVIGSEGKGMGRLVKEKCDFLIKLPMAGKVTSLNASVAAGLLMYEVYRKRNPVGE